jgi:chromosome segregation protein
LPSLRSPKVITGILSRDFGHPKSFQLRGGKDGRRARASERARIAAAEATRALTIAEEDSAAFAVRELLALDGLFEIEKALSGLRVSVDPRKPEEFRKTVLQYEDDTAKLEQALFILEASSTHDRVSSLEARVEQLRSSVDLEETGLAAAERAVEAARQIDNASKSVTNEALTEQFDTVLPLLKELYARLRPHTDWREIDTDFGGRVRASLNFSVGEGRNPQFLFSSGQRRAAGIAFLLAIHLSRPWCELRSLLLDDPVQHIDDYRALNLAEVLSAIRKTGRQIVVAVEDGALADLLCRRLRSTPLEPGRRIDLGVGSDGSALIEKQYDISFYPREILPLAEAS